MRVNRNDLKNKLDLINFELKMNILNPQLLEQFSI